MELFLEVLLDTLLDSAKLLPILFLTYLIMETVEHYSGERTMNFIRRSRGWGPFAGALLGVVPQCGIAGGAANLYTARVISVGTFISVMLATSDEMLPILISSGAGTQIFKIVAYKVIFSMAAGFVVDLSMRLASGRRADCDSGDDEINIHGVCECEGCHCGHGILKPAVTHTVKVGLLIFVISLVIGLLVEIVGSERIAALPINTPIIGEIIAAVLGLIPSCSISVMLTDFYLDGIIGIGPMMSGLLVNGGIGLLVLFRMNHGKKYLFGNFAVTAALVLLGFSGGVIASLVL